MVEVGGLLISIRQTSIPGDVAGETRSVWTLELVGVSGRTCTVSWCTLERITASSQGDLMAAMKNLGNGGADRLHATNLH